MKRWARTALLLLAVAGLIYAGVVFLENRFIYFPARAITATPADSGLDFEDVYFSTGDDVRLHGWWIAGDADRPTLLWFHGNGGNLSDRVEIFAKVHDEIGVGIFAIDYRGYGRSEGSPSEEGLYADAAAALETVIARTDTESSDVVAVGQSLGSAVAVELATDHEFAGVVLEAPFTSVPDMARHHYSPLPVAPLLRTGFDTKSKIGGIGAPLLVVHGHEDDIVPVDMGREVYDAAPEPKVFEVIAGAGHNDIFLSEAYLGILRAFLEELERSG